jgi:hypothetical protein
MLHVRRSARRPKRPRPGRQPRVLPRVSPL